MLSVQIIFQKKSGRDIPEANNLIKQLTGSFMQSVDDNGYRRYYLFIDSENVEEQLVNTLGSLNKVITSVYGSGLNELKIRLKLNPRNYSNEYQKIFFFTFLWELLFRITILNSEIKKPVFTFEFDSIEDKKIFEKSITRLNKPEYKLSSPFKSNEERIESIAKKAWTKNPEYIQMLKSILSIIDEEDVPILIVGESGVGKSYLAKIIHNESTRANNSFEEQNCGGLKSENLSQKLFGWKKGSFTGAISDFKGKIAKADKGTLFLDEIDRTNIEVRNSLLTFIETKKYEPIGGNTQSADVRIIYGTNKNLTELINQGKFEEDFYYRISERIIRIPPLKERRDDIGLISNNILTELNERKDSYISLDSEALEYLEDYSWPGNIRELHHYIKTVFYDCIFENDNIIKIDRLKDTPFNTLSAVKENDFETFKDLMLRFLESWDPQEGPFVNEFIHPIISKIYIDAYSTQTNKTQKKKHASDIIGLDGSRFNDSTLGKAYEKYELLVSKY